MQEIFWKYLITFLWSAGPFLEMRFSIPYAYLGLHLSFYESMIVSLLGSFFSAFILSFFLPGMVSFFEKKIPWIHSLLQKIFHWTHLKHSKRFEVFKEVALVFVVAVPFPGTGVWTGSILAYLLGIEKKSAFFLLCLGALFSALIVGFFTFAGFKTFDFFFPSAASF